VDQLLTLFIIKPVPSAKRTLKLMLILFQDCVLIGLLCTNWFALCCQFYSLVCLDYVSLAILPISKLTHLIKTVNYLARLQ